LNRQLEQEEKEAAMSLVVTGATGHLGRLAVEALLGRGVAADQIVATGRNTDKLADLAARGVTVRTADYTDPASLVAAFAGADKVLLISSSEVGQRAVQHRNAVDAAREAGVSLLAYTSILRADTSTLVLAPEHKATEEYIRESGVPFVFLRNGWYTENWTGQVATAVEHGVVLGAADGGRVSAATRADYAAAAAAVLTGEGHEGKAYELGGDEAFTLDEYAAEVARQSGKPVAYQNLSEQEYATTLAGYGLPQPVAEMLADSDAGIARGELLTETGDLSRLAGRPTTPLSKAVADALA
jgi:NAD(P)H dehydrogenase (quinone)